MAIKRLIFVRHGESRHLVDGLTGGWTDTPLTPRGRRQATATADHLAEADLTGFGLFTSDLTRARETAEIIGNRIGLAPTPLRSLREINNGEATGLSVAEAERIARPAPDGVDQDWSRFPGGESLRALDARMRKALQDLERSRYDRVLVIGHGFSGTVLLKTWLGIPLLPYVAFNLGPGSVSELSVNEWSEPCIERLNSQFGEA
jgi:broad specificity phosphatase PhoE